ncbi:MAG: thiamine-phosphate kinase [Gammaproteobacteria bacterium]|nr:thiamine-phosphate kinase [Gammaproteobacteria bacterium]
MDEFELIRHYFGQLTGVAETVALGIGDDAALLQPPAAELLAVTTDTLIAGRHFPAATAPFDIGWKALAVNLSDLAAMGARPYAFLLALSLPEALANDTGSGGWIASFAGGLQSLALQHGICLVGGDITRGRLSITITALGSVPEKEALRRRGARAGDAVCVTGTLGDAALALQRLQTAAEPGGFVTEAGFLRQRLDRPCPRIAAGLALRGLAHAAIDLSDGLAGDLAHVLAASGVGAEIRIDALPMSPAFERLHPPAERLRLQTCGGDDYELCACIPAARMAQARARLEVPLTEIGRIVATPGLRWFDSADRTFNAELHGYRHF